MKLLVIEDNYRLADRIKRLLRKSHSIDIVGDGQSALDKVFKFDYDAIVLDLNLPDMKGQVVCLEIRKIHKSIPIIVVTGVSDIPTKVALLNAGVDDFITKPFSGEEFEARINALLRRKSERVFTQELRYKDLVMNLDKRTVYRQNQLISLRRKEFDILEYLIANKGRILTREMIMHHAWDEDSTTWKSAVDVHIKHLRDKVDRPYDYSLIKTAYGLGYTLNED